MRAPVPQTPEPLFELRVRDVLYVRVQRMPVRLLVLAYTALSALGPWLVASVWH